MDAEKEFVVLMVLIFLISTNTCTDDVLPTFIMEPTSTTVFEGQNLTLTCEAGPCCEVKVRWMYNGSYLGDFPANRRLTVKDTKLSIASFSSSNPIEVERRQMSDIENHEIFQCVATNRIGSIISRPAVITYARGERLANRSIHQTMSAFEGNTVIVPCRSAVKNLCLSVEWEFNGNHLRQPSSLRHRVLPSNSLQIDDFSDLDVGTYRCLCFYSVTFHQLVFSSVHLKVEKSLTNFTSKFVWTSSQNQQVVEGQTLVLECAAVGRPKPLITWLRYGGILSPERHLQNQGVLSIRDAHKTDEGTYICRAENTAGPQQIHVVFVDVLQSPKITSPPLDQVTTHGNRVAFTCKSRGFPRPSVAWYHNAVPLVNNASVKITSDGALVLAEAAENQSGIYQCMVSNTVNSTSASARLIVYHNEPTTESHLRTGQIYYKGDSNFQLMPSRSPIPTSVITSPVPSVSTFPAAKWENHLPEPKADSKELAVGVKETKLMQSDGARRPNHKKSNPRDPRTYQTQKKSSQGQMGMNLVPPSRPSAKVISDTSVELRWTKGRADGLNVTLFKVQFKEIKTQKHRKSARWHTIDEDISPDVSEFTVVDLKPGSAYQFRLVAIYSNNDNKHSPNSEQVLMSVTGQQVKIPLTAPIIVAVNSLSDSEISIKWQYMPIKREVAIGFMLHYKPYETPVGYKQFVVHGIDKREAILPGLIQDTTYSLRMQSFNAEGFSDFSNTVVKKTAGPSDNMTDIYPLQNHTPLHSSFDDDHHDPISNEDGDDLYETRRNAGTTVGVESNVPLSRTMYSQHNKDLLFVVLGVVLGGVFIIVVFIVVFCFWRQRQQRLFIAAMEGRHKTCNVQHAFHANGLAMMELKHFAGEPIKNADQCSRKMVPSKKDHIPNYLANGCHMNSGSARSRDYLENGVCCKQNGPLDEDCHLLQRLPLNKSTDVCNQCCPKTNARLANASQDQRIANSRYGSPSDTSDVEGIGSETRLPPVDCADINNSECLQVSSNFKSPHVSSEICQKRPCGNCVCDHSSCCRTLVLPLEPASVSLPNSIGRCRSGSTDNLKRSCTSDCSSSSASSSLSGCSYRCNREQRCIFEKNDSGVYEEHSYETTSENKPRLSSDRNHNCAL